MTERYGKAIAWGLAALSVAFVTAFIAVTFTLPSPVDESGEAFLLVPAMSGMLAFAGVGALIASRTGNLIGWIFLAIAALVSATFVAFAYADYAVPHAAPLAAIAAWLSQWLFIGVLALPVAVFFLYPTGTPASDRWRWVWRVYLVALAVNTTGWAVLPFETELGGVTVSNPFGLERIGGSIGSVLLVAGSILLACAFLSFASLIVRFRRAGDEERQQIRWLAVVGIIAAFALTLGVTSGALADTTGSRGLELISNVMLVILVAAVTLGIPIASGVAILTFRLYEIDVVIRKTVVFGILVILIMALSLGVLLSLGSPLTSAATDETQAVGIAGVVVGLLVWPLWRVSRRIADRLVFGGRASPYEVMTGFADSVGGTYSADDVLLRMAEVLGEATGAEVARVWLRVGEELRSEASWPADAPIPGALPVVSDQLPSFEPAHAAEVRHQGELLGALSVAMRASDPMNASKEKLVRDLAAQSGPVLRNVRLLEDLRESRRRIVAAQDERAKQLERNIHDGAQQQLVALMVKLRLAEGLAEREPAKTRAMLGELQAEATSALEDLRDLARGIYPPLLADKGLGAALEAQARRAAVHVSVETEGIGRYPPDVESAVYFCCLEALQNVAKYAHATHADMRLSGSRDALTFEVVDDGDGFDLGSTRRGSGLIGMADRLDAIGGTLEVWSQPGKGTTVAGRVSVGATGQARLLS